MSLSQIRNQVNALQLKFAKELTIYRLRQLAQELSDDWALAVADGQELPQPLQVVRRVAGSGMLLNTYMNLHRYVERCRREGSLLGPVDIVLALLPWAGHDRYADLFRLDFPAPD